MNEASDRMINLFGALAVGVADRVRWASLNETAFGGETAAALVVLGHTPGLSIDQLGRVLRLSHPGAVRLVDRLVSAGFAVRSPISRDRRTLALNLTEVGQMRRSALLKRRREALQAVLASVTSQDLLVLERISGNMLRTLPTDAITALTVCRFCDVGRCTDCPMDAFGTLG